MALFNPKFGSQPVWMRFDDTASRAGYLPKCGLVHNPSRPSLPPPAPYPVEPYEVERHLLQSCQCCEKDRRDVREERRQHAMAELAARVDEERQGRLAAEARVAELVRAREESREGRIEAYHKKAARKLFNAALSKGWESLCAMYNEARYRQQLINLAQSKMGPMSTRKAFSKWKIERQHKYTHAERSRAELVERLQAEIRELTGQQTRMKEELAAAVKRSERELAEVRAAAEAREAAAKAELAERLASQRAQIERAAAATERMANERARSMEEEMEVWGRRRAHKRPRVHPALSPRSIDPPHVHVHQMLVALIERSSPAGATRALAG